MITNSLTNIQNAQKEYQNLVLQYNKILKKDINIKIITMFLDEIKFFWLEKLNIIDFELEELTKNNTCFLLCGAIYLNVSNYEHYYFKSIGDYHLLFDPFLKMEPFCRLPEKTVNINTTIDYFKKVLLDTIEILAKYKNHFYILPIRELSVENNEKHHKLLEKFFLSFISSSFGKEFKSRDDFCSQFQKFEQIENEIKSYVLEKLIFNDQKDNEIPLRKRIEKFYKHQMSFAELTKDLSEPQIFLQALYSWFPQVIDTLLICTYLRLNPYISSENTFHYLTLIMHTFIENEKLKAMIERTIYFYIFRKTLNIEKFKTIKFEEYCMKIKDMDLIKTIQSKMHCLNIDIFQGGIKQVELIIKEEFNNHFNSD